jgi:hypothetical protein
VVVDGSRKQKSSALETEAAARFVHHLQAGDQIWKAPRIHPIEKAGVDQQPLQQDGRA